MFEGIGHDAMKPLLFPILSKLTPKEYEIEFWDERVEKLPEHLDADVIAFSVETFAAKRAYNLSKKYKTEKNIIVMGGFHPSILPEECLNYCDSVIVGDAEDTWPDFLLDHENLCIKKIYRSNYDKPLSKIDMDNGCFKNKKYLPLATLQFSRGCKYNCSFCSVKTMYKNIRQKSIEDIVEELKVTEERLLFFLDDNLVADEEHAMEFLKAIKPLKKKWACQISIDVANNDKLLKAMKESGCALVIIGFESLDPDNLKQMKKSANIRQKDYEKAINNIYKHKLLIYATFVFGYDFDDEKTIDDVIHFALRHNFTVANFGLLTPMPGTGIYEDMEREGRLIYKKWWIDDNYRYGDTMFVPKKLSTEKFVTACERVRLSFYSIPNILKRLFKNPLHFKSVHNLFIYLTTNIVARREIKRKNGRILG